MATTFSEFHESADYALDLIIEDYDLFDLVAYELKNPITAIRGQAQLLRHLLGQSAQPEWARVLDRVGAIDAAAVEMLQLANELLDASRERRGRPNKLARRPMDLVALVTAVVEARQRWTTHHRLKVQALAPEIVGA